MKYTCAEAAKLLRKLNQELYVLRNKEEKSCIFTAAVEEDIEAARPEFDYQKEKQQQLALERKIRTLKHAINRFNLETEVPGFGMTIDELLVYIPQLSERKRKLIRMATALPKERVSNPSCGTKIIEYTYTNYDIKEVQEDLEQVTDELSNAQIALDQVNHQAEMEIDI